MTDTMIGAHNNNHSNDGHDDNDNDVVNEQLGLRRRIIFPDVQQQQQSTPLQEGESSSSSSSNDFVASNMRRQQHHQMQLGDKGEQRTSISIKLPPPSTSTSNTLSSSPSPNRLSTSSTRNISTDTAKKLAVLTAAATTAALPTTTTTERKKLYIFSTDTLTGQILTYISQKIALSSTRSGSALPGFLSLLLLTMANYMLSPMRDATALAVGVSHIPTLTLASTILALVSSVPMGRLFEVPDPMRRGKHWRDRIGLTRGETQGTSLALFLRCFAICLVGYALTFKVLEWFDWNMDQNNEDDDLDDLNDDG